MQWYEADVKTLEAARAQQGPTRSPFVFYGSSTLRLWANLPGDLQEPRAVNLGFGGSTLEACAFFFERLVVPEQPCSLIIYAGDNDLGDGRSPEQVLEYFTALTDKVRLHLGSLPYTFISVKPSPARVSIIDDIRGANALIQEAIQEQPNASYIDVFEAMLNGDGSPRTELFDSEGLHMSRAGYELWTELLLSHRDQIFPQESCLIGAARVSLKEE